MGEDRREEQELSRNKKDTNKPGTLQVFEPLKFVADELAHDAMVRDGAFQLLIQV